MQYSPEALKRVHETEVEILQEVIRVCEENDIPYFSVGGTTLGAIRHDGFIPWDDDIDVGMLRDDYERFLQIAPSKLKKGYTLQHFSVEKNAPAYYAKVRKDDTEFVEENMRHVKMHHGIFVDIFPHDFVPDDDKQMLRHHKRALMLNQLYLAKTLWTVPASTPKAERIRSDFIRTGLHIALLPIPKKVLFDKCDREMRRYNGVCKNRIVLWGWKVWVFRAADVLPCVPHKFENIEIQVPNNSDATLTAQYGNWRQLPPKEKQINHQPVKLRFE